MEGSCLLAGLQFRGLAYYYHGGKHSSIEADMVLEKELRVLTSYLMSNRKWSETLGMA